MACMTSPYSILHCKRLPSRFPDLCFQTQLPRPGVQGLHFAIEGSHYFGSKRKHSIFLCFYLAWVLCYFHNDTTPQTDRPRLLSCMLARPLLIWFKARLHLDQPQPTDQAVLSGGTTIPSLSDPYPSMTKRRVMLPWLCLVDIYEPLNSPALVLAGKQDL